MNIQCNVFLMAHVVILLKHKPRDILLTPKLPQLTPLKNKFVNAGFGEN
jgi:hypothetical protein